MQPKGLLKFLKLEGFLQNVTEYVENRISIAKLEAKQKVADVGSTIAALIPAALFGLFALIFLSIALAMAFNVWLTSAVWGFVIVGAIYLIGAVVMFSQRDAVWLKKKIVDGSTKFLKETPKQEKKEGEEAPSGYHAEQVEHTKVIFEDTLVEDRQPGHDRQPARSGADASVPLTNSYAQPKTTQSDPKE